MLIAFFLLIHTVEVLLKKNSIFATILDILKIEK